ncbi:MAG TPA: restriction endonuclease subunit S [Pyrinomonadaceae bacterium]|jgi:restriction endonuclease S subunit
MTQRNYLIGELCSIVKGTYPTLKTEPGEYPLVVTAEQRRSASTFQLEGPAVCVPLISSTGHGNAALHRVHYQEGKFALANLLVALLPKDSSLCDAKYLYHLLMAKKDEYFVPLMLGTANVSLKERDIAGVRVSLPPLSEQRRIVARIEELAAKIDEARGLRTQAIEEAELLLAAILRETRKSLLQSKHRRQTLGELTQVTSGGTPSREISAYWNGDIPWIKTGELLDGDIYEADERVTQEGLENSSAKVFPPNTVLIALYGQGQTRGRTGRLMIEATTNQACCAILPTPRILEPRYTQYWLRSLYYEMREQNYGGAQPNWSGKMIKNIEITLPSLPEQRRIIKYLDTLQSNFCSLKHLQAETATELDALMPAILDRAFKGEL